MEDQTNRSKSFAPQNSHEKCRARYEHMIGRVCHSAARESPEARFSLAPYQGKGRYPAHKKDRVCLPLRAWSLRVA